MKTFIWWGDALKGSLERVMSPRPLTSTLFKILTLICLFYIKNQIVFQTNITEIDTLEKIIGIANVNCLSLAFTVSLRLPAPKHAVHENLSYYA